MTPPSTPRLKFSQLNAMGSEANIRNPLDLDAIGNHSSIPIDIDALDVSRFQLFSGHIAMTHLDNRNIDPLFNLYRTMKL
jgi:hypothetical protein